MIDETYLSASTADVTADVKLAESSESTLAAQTLNPLTPEEEQANEQSPAESALSDVSVSTMQNISALDAAIDEQLKKLKEKSLAEKPQVNFSTRVTHVQSMLEIAQERHGVEDPPMLWNGMIMEGSLVVLFGRTGVNKSTITTQILANYCANNPQDKVLLIDMEMSKRTQGRRIYDKQNERVAPLIQRCGNRFLRATIGRDFPDLSSKLREIETLIDQNEAVVVVIDNLTFLEPELEKGKYGQIMMDEIKDMYERLSQKRTTTLICVSHTPKLEPGIPLHETQVGGSMRVGNAFHEIIGIGVSVKGTNVRYVKQCKARECERRYTDNSVLVGTIQTVDGMLQFVTDGTTTPEFVHLNVPKQANSERVVAVRNDLNELLVNSGMKKEACVMEVAKKYGISPSTVRNYMSKYSDTGMLIRK